MKQSSSARPSAQYRIPPVVRAVIDGLQDLAFEDQGGVGEVRSVLRKVPLPLPLAPREAFGHAQM